MSEFRFTPSDLDGDKIIVGHGAKVLGTFITHPGWAWWPVETLDGKRIAHVRKDREAAAKALLDCEATK